MASRIVTAVRPSPRSAPARRAFRSLERVARGRPRLQRLARTLGAASQTKAPLAFALRELAGRRTSARYRLRNGLVAVVRHPLLDMFVLEEVFRERAYEFPAGLAERLAARPRPPSVLDLGGHVGLFALFVLGELDRARVVSYEPDPRNAEALRGCIAANALEGRWRLVEAAAATAPGSAAFVSGFQLSGLSAAHEAIMPSQTALVEQTFPFLADSELMSPVPVEVPVVDALPALAGADLIKVDVEGSEWPILADPRFAELEATAIVLEYHAATCPEPDAEACLRRLLERAGFEIARMEGDAHGAGIAWGVRPEG